MPPGPPEPLVLSILVVAGFVSAVVNTIAGGGSLLVLPLLVWAGLPPAVANGTNRVSVVLQNVVAIGAFRRQGIDELGVAVRLLPATCVGALAGARLATVLPDAALEPIFAGVFVAWGLALVVRPGRFLEPRPTPRAPGAAGHVFALAVGFYGGFLQAGVGIPLLALLVSFLGHPAVRANAAKVVLVFVFTLLALPVFVLAGHVSWREGLALGVGSMLGAWVGAHWQVRVGAKLVRWLVIVMLFVSAAAMAR